MQSRLLPLLLFALLIPSQIFGQTPGMIIKPANAPGNAVLDPDGDGYISRKTNGVQLGFTVPPDNDVTTSEIPFVPIVRPDPTGDLERGPVGSFTEIVGTDAAGNNAIMVYNDGTNLLFRFRLGGYAPNSKSYSIMVDTDQKFGFTGVNADPNAVAGNAGFELEIVLRTNFSVDVYNVNGTTSGTLSATHPYETNGQKSLAVSNAGGSPDYFYDFYIPLSDLTPLGVTTSTPLRFVSVTVMNPNEAIGNNALSDIGGVTSGSNIDAIFTNLIDGQTPISTGNINNGGVLDRSACPSIDPVSYSGTKITGSSTEATGTTINIYVYQSDGTTLIGSGSTSTSGSTWSIDVSALSPAVTLVAGQIVKATATASEKGMSYDNCSMQTVSDCAGATSTTVILTKISGSKGYTVTNTFAAGTIFTWYNSDLTLAHFVTKSGGSTYIVNPQTSSAPGELMTFSTETGQTFPAGVFYFTFQEPGKCVSSLLSDCQYSVSGTSVAPVITTTVITTNTHKISGTCGSSAGTLVSLFAGNVYLKCTTVVSGTTWEIDGMDLSPYDCASIVAKASDIGKCPTASPGVPVSHVAIKPNLVSSGCSLVLPVTALSGNSVEADGSIITLYNTASGRTIVGTATVSSGSWTASGLSLAAGANIVAAVTSGSCVTKSADSDPITITQKTNVASYTVSISVPTEGESSVSGTISGGSYPVTLKLYVDGTQVGAGKVINAGGPWNVSSLLSNDLYTGGIVRISITGTGCESDLSSANAVVQCSLPSTPQYTGGTFSYCVNGVGSINLTTSQAGVIYQLVNNSGVAVGPSALGKGGPIPLYTNVLTGDISNIFVKAYKIGFATCSSTAASLINFTLSLPTPTVTFTNMNVAVQQGVTSANLPFSALSGIPLAETYTIDYSVAAKAQGFVNVTTPAAIPAAPGNITLVVPAGAVPGVYAGTISVKSSGGTTCSGNYSFTVTVFGASAPPVINLQPMGQSICSGSTANLSVSAAGAGVLTYKWQSSTSFYGPFADVVGGSGATTAGYTTTNLTQSTFYRVAISNAYGSTTSNIVEVSVNAIPVAVGSIFGSNSLCSGTTGTYSITNIDEANSYTWNYDGSNVAISGSSNSVSIAFASNATSGNLTVSGNNSCGSSTPLTQYITVNSTPFVNDITSTGCSGTAFTVTPTNGVNGFVPAGTTYIWGVPTVTGGITGGASGSGSGLTGTISNITSSIQTATYTVTPSKNGCTLSSFTVTVSIYPRINLTATPVDLTCNGVSTGSVTLAATGGTPGYTYSWTGPSSYISSNQNISNLASGTYNLTVSDSKSCIATTSVAVNQPSVMVITPTPTNPSCNGSSTGALFISVSGGVGSKTYLWNDGSSLQNRTNLAAGSYSLTVTDGNGCTQTSLGNSLVNPSVISASASASPIPCNGGTSIITVNASGGTGSLTYSLNGGTYQPGNTFSGVLASASDYNITVKDANGCSQTAAVTVTQPAALTLSTAITNESCPGSNNGAIDLTVNGGTAPYSYLWTGGSTTQDQSGLTTGTYTVTVQDTNGCVAIATTTIADINPSPVAPGTITK